MSALRMHPARALSGMRSSLYDPFARRQDPQRGVEEVVPGAQNDPARAVGTPPHLRASLSGFYADVSRAQSGPHQCRDGRERPQRRMQIYASSQCTAA